MTPDDQTVQNVYDHLCNVNGDWQPIGPNDIREILTAAAPFLQGVKPGDLVNEAEILASDMPHTVVKKLDDAYEVRAAIEPASSPRAQALEEAARHLLHDIDDLVANSEGVFGLHKNGDNAPWDELLEGGRYEGWLASVEGLRSALSSQPVADVSAASRDVLAERRRQVEKEGWTPEHDDQWQSGEMSGAAACYALNGATYKAPSHYPPRKVYAAVAEARRDAEKDMSITREAIRMAIGEPKAPTSWPWNAEWWKPSDRRRNLVKSGALILAEIERLDRLPASPGASATRPTGGSNHGE